MTRRIVCLVFLAASVLSAGCFRHHHRPPRADVAAISDLHLGDPRSLLHDTAGRAVLVGAIATAAAERGVDTLVLNGDVLELALASEQSAFDSARALFGDLNRVRGLERVVLVVGNHDHRLFETIAEPLPAKLGREYDEGTRFHEEVAAVCDRLRVTVVYPGWTVPVRGGAVHFTHGHYFDRLVTPSFDGATSLAELEERNARWWGMLNAGGTDETIRSVYRAAYHLGHHVSGFVDSALPDGGEDEPAELSDAQQARIAAFLAHHLRDPAIVALVSGHTHDGGGRVATVHVDADDGSATDVGVFNPGAFVVGHNASRPRPHLFFLDTRSGEMRLEPLEVPPELVERTRARAWETIP